MAVITDVHSGIIEALGANPPTLLNPGVFGGTVKVQIGHAAIADDQSVGSITRFFRVKSTDTVLSILLFHAETLTALAGDWGLYRTEQDGGAVVDVDAYASAVAMATANVLAGQEVAYEARAITAMGQPVWDDIASQTVDTHLSYDIAMTITIQVTDPGTLTAMLFYIENN